MPAVRNAGVVRISGRDRLLTAQQALYVVSEVDGSWLVWQRHVPMPNGFGELSWMPAFQNEMAV
jgi:hypothetical protein